MRWNKVLKTSAVTVAVLFAAVGLINLVFIGKAVIRDLRVGFVGPALDNPTTKSLLATCVEHKNNTARNDVQSQLSEPLFSNQKVVEWLNMNLPHIMSLNHNTIHEQLLAGEKYFTPEGWCSFINALADSNIVDSVVKRKLDVKMNLEGQPIVKSSQVRPNGVYTWYIEAPVSFSFKGNQPGQAGPPDIANEVLVLRLERSSAKTNLDGIGIAQWVTIQGH